MIVDDADDQLQLMRTVFKIVDPMINVTLAQSGDDALSYLRQNSIPHSTVVLLDVRMPGKSGIDVLKEIKADTKLKGIPVCMFSNGDIQTDIRESYLYGSCFYFRKPTGIENLKRFASTFKTICFEFASY